MEVHHQRKDLSLIKNGKVSVYTLSGRSKVLSIKIHLKATLTAKLTAYKITNLTKVLEKDSKSAA